MSTFTARYIQREGRDGSVDHVSYSQFKRMAVLKPVTFRLPVTTIAKMQLLMEQRPEIWESQQEMMFEMIESAIQDWIKSRDAPQIAKAFDEAAHRALQHPGLEEGNDVFEDPAQRKTWKVDVRGLVSRVAGRARVAVQPGPYQMREIALGRYQLSGKDKPTFDLSITEVSTYLNGKQLKIEGRFP